jgi:mono/diheme cytochrome c family protein
MNSFIATAALLSGGALFVVQAHAADANLIQQGKAAFEYHCAACHGTTIVSGNQHLPGTEALMVKYQGKEPGALEQRTDLSADLVKFFVRHGVSVMPFFRKTMVSDADLDAIAAYLSRNYRAPGAGNQKAAPPP